MSGRGWNLVGIILGLAWAGGVGMGVIASSEQLSLTLFDLLAELSTGDPDEAASESRSLVIDLPDLPTATAAARAGDYALAIEIYTARLEKPSLTTVERRSVLLRRGDAYRRLGRDREAEADFREMGWLFGLMD